MMQPLQPVEKGSLAVGQAGWFGYAALGLFALLYWVAAWTKPFHVDEFYSWVYAERLTFTQILRFEDFGIGHPPLYHLLQKLVMELVPGYHFFHIRLVNFGAGLLFVWLLARMLGRNHAPGIFILAIAGSAAVLNVFVFARMWGLVCLSALVLVMAGERYIRTRDVRFLPVLVGLCLIGLFADYNFILMLPYLFLVVACRDGALWPVKVMYGVLGVALMAAMALRGWMDMDGGMAVYHWITHFPLSIPRLSFVAAHAVLQFWFFEPFMVAVLTIPAAVWAAGYRANGLPGLRSRLKAHPGLLFVFLFIGIEIFIRFTSIRARFAVILVFGTLATACWFHRRSFWSASTAADRMSHAMLGGALVLVMVSPLFWRDLRGVRFLALMLPCFFMWVTLQFDRKGLHLLSVALIASGALYVSSNGISEYFPPFVLQESTDIIYQDISAYATQHLKTGGDVQDAPEFLDIGSFDQSCRVCTMGRQAGDVSGRQTVRVLGGNNFEAEGFAAAIGMTLKAKCAVGLSLTDRLQFKYFTPLYDRRYVLYEFRGGSGEDDRAAGNGPVVPAPMPPLPGLR